MTSGKQVTTFAIVTLWYSPVKKYLLKSTIEELEKLVKYAQV